MLVPVGVVAQAAALASFPFLASLLAQKKFDEFNTTLQRALHSSLVFIIPLTVFMILQSENILGLIFEGGHFSHEETLLATPLLQIMLISVPFWAIQQIVGRAFYAHKSTIIPAIIGTIATIIALPFYIYFVPIYGSIVVASMTTFSLFIYTLLLLIVWKKTKAFALTLDCLLVSLRSLAICIIPLLLAFYSSQLLNANNNINHNFTFFDKFINLSISAFFFGVSWLLLSYYLNRKDLLLIVEPFLRKIKKIKKI